MFYTAVLSLRVFSDGDQVYVIVRGLVSLYGLTGADIGIQVKGPSSKTEINRGNLSIYK